MKWKRQIQNEYTSPFFSYKLKIIMRWNKLFERLPTADEIYFRYYDISFDLKESPKYLEYIKEKIALRHDIEKKYKSNISEELSKTNGQPYRIYFENLAYKFAYYPNKVPSDFLCDADREVQTIVKDFVEKHRPFQKEMEEFLVSEECHFGRYLRNIGLFPYLKRIRIEPYFYQLKDSTVSGNVSFSLNDESKNVIIHAFKDTNSIFSEEMAILKDGQTLFYYDEYGGFFQSNKK